MSLPTETSTAIDGCKISEYIDEQQQFETVNKNDNEKKSVIETVNTSIHETSLSDNNESICTETVASINPASTSDTNDLETSLANYCTVADTASPKTASSPEISSNNNNNNNHRNDSNDSNSISTQVIKNPMNYDF